MIPKELQDQRQWIKLPPGQKFTKEPNWQKHPLGWNDIQEPYGRGFLLLGTPYLCIDGDHVLKDGEFVTPWAKSFFESLLDMGTYAEESLSGTGIHVFFKLDPSKTYGGLLDKLKGMTAKGGTYYNYTLPGFEDMPKANRPHVEIFYNAGQQICLTGKSLAGSTILHAPSEVNGLLEKMAAFIVPPAEPRQAATLPEIPPDYDRQRVLTMLDYIDPASVDYQDWVKVGAVLKDQGIDVSVWDAWSQRDTARYKGAREIDSKWASFRGGGATIASLHSMAKAGGYSEKDFAREWYREHPTAVDPAKDFFDLGPEESPAGGTISPQDSAPVIRQAEMPDPFAGGTSELVEAVKSKAYEPVPTHIWNIDEVLSGGLIRKQIFCIGGEPGSGKSSLSQQIAESMIQHNPEATCLYFCYEMSKDQLQARGISRLLHQEKGLTLRALDILRGKEGWQEGEEQYREQIAGRLAYYTLANKLKSCDLKETIEHMEYAAKYNYAHGRPAPLVVIDYLQLVTVEGLEERLAIKAAIVALKAYAMRHNTNVIAVQAQNRDTNKAGTVSMFGGLGSSSLEYTADIMAVISQTDVLDKIEPVRKYMKSLSLVKGRWTGTDSRADFVFHGAYNDFEPVDPFRLDLLEEAEQMKEATAEKKQQGKLKKFAEKIHKSKKGQSGPPTAR